MAKTRDIQDVGILLAARWKLVPVDDRNWELCELRAVDDNARSRAAGTAGAVRWQRCGRFYQYGTVEQAMLYVLDQLAKDKAWAQQMELQSALVMWRGICEDMREYAKAAKGAMS